MDLVREMLAGSDRLGSAEHGRTWAMSAGDYHFDRVTADRLARAMSGDVRNVPSALKVAEAKAIIDHLGFLYRLRASETDTTTPTDEGNAR